MAPSENSGIPLPRRLVLPWLRHVPRRAPRISGMATPHGVYLSNGVVFSGSRLGLSLSIFSLAATLLAAYLITVVLVWAVDDAVPAPLMAIRMAAPLAGEVRYEPLWRTLMEAVQFLAFFTLLRFTPLSGYHAAEHMTVHAIEAGWELTEENVRKMSRVHGRCGSNILGWLLPLLILLPITSYYPWYLVVPGALGGGYLLRRVLGPAVQWMFTTASPSSKQLRIGIEAGRSLLRKYSAATEVRLSRLQVACNRGLLHMAIAVVVLMAIQFVVGGWVSERYYEWLAL